jgi:hypothetical protein
MQPGGKLQPLPDAAPHLELLKARISYDLTGKSAEKRVMLAALVMTACFVLLLIRNLASGESLAGVIVGYGILMLIMGAGFLWNRKRNARFESVLRQAGLTPVQDHNGRTRFVPPGSGLPEQHSPFGQQAFGGPQQAPPGPAAPPAPGYPVPHQQGGYGHPGQPPYGQPQPGPQAPPGQQPQPGFGGQGWHYGPPHQEPQPPYPPQHGAGS